MKVSHYISKRVVNIGPSFKPVAGGIAQVMAYYNDYLFDDFQFIENSCPGSKLKKLYCATKAIISLFTLLFFNRVDIIHIHTASKISFKRSVIFARLGFIFNKKVIMHIHAGSFMEYYSSTPNYVYSILNRCDKVIALSEVWKAQFESVIGLKNVAIINNIIPKPSLIEHATYQKAVVHGLFLGAIKEEKGIFDLLDIIISHKNELENKFILHVGGNEQVTKLLKIVKENNLENIVHFEGWVGDEKKESLFNTSDIMFLPSYIEGLPICILEAMSYRLSIISTKIGGIPSIINNGKNGLLVEPGDKVELWRATQKLISDFEMRNRFGQESRLIIKCYYPDYVANQLESLYKELI